MGARPGGFGSHPLGEPCGLVGRPEESGAPLSHRRAPLGCMPPKRALSTAARRETAPLLAAPAALGCSPGAHPMTDCRWLAAVKVEVAVPAHSPTASRVGAQRPAWGAVSWQPTTSATSTARSTFSPLSILFWVQTPPGAHAPWTRLLPLGLGPAGFTAVCHPKIGTADPRTCMCMCACSCTSESLSWGPWRSCSLASSHRLSRQTSRVARHAESTLCLGSPICFE